LAGLSMAGLYLLILCAVWIMLFELRSAAECAGLVLYVYCVVLV
jgi:hypothetical protein